MYCSWVVADITVLLCTHTVNRCALTFLHDRQTYHLCVGPENKWGPKSEPAPRKVWKSTVTLPRSRLGRVST